MSPETREIELHPGHSHREDTPLIGNMGMLDVMTVRVAMGLRNCTPPIPASMRSNPLLQDLEVTDL